jgi:perosamine synthetase
VASVDLTAEEAALAMDAIQSSWISSAGEYLERFEMEFAAHCGCSSALGVCNGTAALHLILAALDLQQGDEVILPSLTFVATANAVRYQGAEPVFVDVEPESWCIDPARIGDAITSHTRGIIAVHLMGHPADMDAINEIAENNGIWVVEDACQAPLALYKGRRAGSLGLAAAFSFFANKVFTCGQGGAVTLSDPELERRMRVLRAHGMDPRKKYVFPVMGYNYGMTNISAALLCGQIARADSIIRRRRAIFDAYVALLASVPGIGFKHVQPWVEACPWMFAITIDNGEFGCTRDDLIVALADRGIEARALFPPLHQQQCFRDRSRTWGASLPVTESLASTALMLPTFNRLSADDLGYIAESIDVIQRGRRIFRASPWRAGAA